MFCFILAVEDKPPSDGTTQGEKNDGVNAAPPEANNIMVNIGDISECNF